jgi:hypothetical protein
VSVRDLDRDHVVATLIACNVNISDAAKRLRVSSSDLRRLVIAAPELMALAFEKEERRLDKAEAILDRELASDDPRYAAAAAFFTLRNAKRAVARGWRQPDVEVSVDASGPPVPLKVLWGNGEHVATMMVPAGTRAPRPLEVEHDDSQRAAPIEENSDDPATDVIERDGQRIAVRRYGGAEPIEGEMVTPPVLIEHVELPVEPPLVEPSTLPPSLPTWPGPFGPPPLVAHLYLALGAAAAADDCRRSS